MAKERATVFPLVPTMAALLVDMDGLQASKVPELRMITNTAAAFPPTYSRKLQKKFPAAKIFSMYGLTECKRVSYLPPDMLTTKPDSVGIPMPNVDAIIIDKNGIECPPGEIGELVVRGSNVMQGYWNAPGETEAKFKPGRLPGERILYTGDLFKKDKEGYLYFVGRKDDMLKIKGERVSPKEIENCLCNMEGIREAAVVGLPDPVWGHSIKAFVRFGHGVDIHTDEIFKHCKKNLEIFMVPKEIEIISSFPKGINGKIDKDRLKKEI
jgi:acyl-CoA synthetase (AMP-forming)/AMP-acid ligase II